MKVLIINGSPHKNGCTATALAEIEQTLAAENIEYERIWLGTDALGGCTGCGYCRKHGECIQNDIVNEVRQKVTEADGFIFGTPVHYASGAGNMIGFMDRLFFSTDRAAWRNKPAAAICSARRAGTTATFDQMNKYFTISEMPIISARYWNMVHGSRAEDVLKDEEGLYNMRVLARNMAYWLRCKQAAKDAGVPLPEQEEPKVTNFIK